MHVGVIISGVKGETKVLFSERSGTAVETDSVAADAENKESDAESIEEATIFSSRETQRGH